MIPSEDKAALRTLAVEVLRLHKFCRGKDEGEVILLASKIIDLIEMSGWELKKRPPDPWTTGSLERWQK